MPYTFPRLLMPTECPLWGQLRRSGRFRPMSALPPNCDRKSRHSVFDHVRGAFLSYVNAPQRAIISIGP